jgi:hypothetical protein
MDSDAFSDEDEDGGRNDDNKRTNKKKSKGVRMYIPCSTDHVD